MRTIATRPIVMITARRPQREATATREPTTPPTMAPAAIRPATTQSTWSGATTTKVSAATALRGREAFLMR